MGTPHVVDLGRELEYAPQVRDGAGHEGAWGLIRRGTAGLYVCVTVCTWIFWLSWSPQRTAAQNCRVHTELTAVCCCVCVRQANGGGDTTPRAYLVADGARESVDPYAPQTWMMVRSKHRSSLLPASAPCFAWSHALGNNPRL